MDKTIKDLVHDQKTYFKTGATKPLSSRIDLLKKLKEILTQNEELLLQALYQDLHKSPHEAFTSEIAMVYEELDLAIKNLKKWNRPQRVGSPLHLKPAHGKTVHEPFGVVAVFAPWNYPLQLLLSPAIGALAAGNTVILKPSDLARHTHDLLARLINENFDRQLFHLVEGDVSRSEALLKERFDFIFFTGSPRVGRLIMSEAAKHLTPVCLELGGKSPCIVDKTANLDIAAKRICWAKFLNAGQTCVAPDYLYVHEEIEEKFLQKCKEVLHKFYGDTPQNSSYYARIISDSHWERLHKLLQGSNVYHGGQSHREDKFMAPTILRDVSWESPIMENEIFGPILPILTFNNLDEVCQKINEHEKPLALYVYSESRTTQEFVLSTTSSGGACVNDCIVHVANHHLPFGGVGESGMGSYHGRKSFELFSHQKSIHVSSTMLDSPMRYGYSSSKFKWSLLKKYFSF